MGTYDVDGATRIERYCNNCIKSVYSREQGFIVSWHIEGERNERLHPIVGCRWASTRNLAI